MIIYKYELVIDGIQNIEMPEGAKILSCQLQYDRLSLWVLADPNVPMGTKQIRIYDTGQLIKDVITIEFIATVQVNSYVLHIFEVIE